MLNIRTILAIAHDLLAVAVAWLLAFWLRFNLDMPEFYSEQAWQSARWVVLLYASFFLISGLYRGIWRFASLPDLQRIIVAVSGGALAVAAALFMLQIAVPRSVLLMSPVLLVMIMGGSRLAYRGWKERRLGALIPAGREPVIVLGATEAAAGLIKDLARSPQWRVVGVFDDDSTHHGRQIHGAMVYGALSELTAQQSRLNARHAIIAMPEANHSERRRAVETARAADLQVLTVPSFDDLISGRVTVSQIRNVELDDLLGRDPVKLDTAGLHEWLGNRVVLVSGAGGSIGSELCRQIARYRPQRIVLLESNEFALYTVEQEFARQFPGVAISAIIGDVKDPARIEQLLSALRPTAVFHAAAYKHVPLMENNNAWQAVLNNVLGSTGSVIPKFREQIAAGGPVTVTHPEITRFFMSIPEAVQLVLQAGLSSRGGECIGISNHLFPDR